MRVLVRKIDTYSFTLSSSFLSAFDLGGSLFVLNDSPLSKGLDYDAAQLYQDQVCLMEDYVKAYERVLQEFKELSKEKE